MTGWPGESGKGRNIPRPQILEKTAIEGKRDHHHIDGENGGNPQLEQGVLPAFIDTLPFGKDSIADRFYPLHQFAGMDAVRQVSDLGQIGEKVDLGAQHPCRMGEYFFDGHAQVRTTCLRS
jgi:hypothetical protein